MRRLVLAAVVTAALVPAPLEGTWAPTPQTRKPDSEPGWSPDGNQVTFRRWTALMSVRPNGERLRILAHRAEVTWLPGGRLGLNTLNGVYVMNRDGSGKRLITSGDQPAWSPDGTKVAVGRHFSERNTSRVVIVDVRTRAERGVAAPSCRCAYTDSEPVWSPTGRRLLFSRFVDDPRGQRDGLYVVDADGRNLRQVIPRLAEHAVWSPSGDAIATLVWTDTSALIVVAAADGGTRRGAWPGSSPAWSPDGRWIAFRRAKSVFISRPDGSSRRELPGPGGFTCVSEASPCLTPAWSFDGSHVAFQSGLDLVVARADGTSAKVVGRGIEPAWSPRSRQIAFATARCGAQQGVHVVEASGRGLRRLSRHCLIHGSEIAERISGTPADDSIDSRDRRRDKVVCLGGTDRADVDVRDVVAPDCETIKRH